MSDLFLETERLELRRFADSDADAGRLVELDSDPEVMRYIGPHRVETVEAYRERIRAWVAFYDRPGQGAWAAVEKVSGAFLGWFFLRPATAHRFAAAIGWTRDAELELGYRLRRAAWGRGYGTEGAAALVRAGLADPAVAAVVATALAANRASTRVMEKAGLTFEREVRYPGIDGPGAVYAARR